MASRAHARKMRRLNPRWLSADEREMISAALAEDPADDIDSEELFRRLGLELHPAEKEQGG